MSLFPSAHPVLAASPPGGKTMLIPENKKFALAAHLPGDDIRAFITLFDQGALKLNRLPLVEVTFKKPDRADFHDKFTSGFLLLNIKNKKLGLAGITGFHFYLNNFAFEGNFLIHIVEMFSLAYLGGGKNLEAEPQQPADHHHQAPKKQLPFKASHSLLPREMFQDKPPEIKYPCQSKYGSLE